MPCVIRLVIADIFQNTMKQPKTFAFDHCFFSLEPTLPHFASQKTVFECLGRDILDNAFEGYNACIFAYGQTDSKSALQHLARCTSSILGTPIAYTILDLLLSLQKHKKYIVIQWIPSHIGIEGNEKVDAHAKQACSEGIVINVPPFLHKLLLFNKKTVQIIAFRLRSGHIPLNRFAFMLKRSTSPNCPDCGVREDVSHSDGMCP
ncbi:jg13156 [Pararge aegeria aegeria]|uniref:Jg13156 protein n=1 Tax=Pararge aegeria aegeria TaxID=348720 RepID=A0A8S4RRZ3_9NEOP|nr:jg13156 [Pararge aegeria aegeria]